MGRDLADDDETDAQENPVGEETGRLQSLQALAMIAIIAVLAEQFLGYSMVMATRNGAAVRPAEIKSKEAVFASGRGFSQVTT